MKIVKAVRVAGKEYYPGDVAEFGEPTAKRLVEQGYGTEVVPDAESRDLQGISPANPIDFESVGDISEVLPTSAGGGEEQYAIDDLVGVPIVIESVKFDKGRSGRLEGKDIVSVQIRKQDGSRGWFTTWSSPMIAQLKQLDELNALPRKCKIEARKGGSGYRYYILASAKSAKAQAGEVNGGR